MNRLKIMSITFLCALVLISSCKTSEQHLQDLDQHPQIEKRPIVLSITPVSRVSDNSFDLNDKIGLYVVNNPNKELAPSGNHVDNMGYTYDGSTWNADEEIYWKDDNTSANFFCYYPYSESVVSVDKYEHFIQLDQSLGSNYELSEFLWGKKEDVAPTNSEVSINVKHVMSKLIVYLKADNGYKLEDLEKASVKICNIQPKAYINLSNGTIFTSDESVKKIIPKKSEEYYTALLVPQNIDNLPFVEVTIDGYTHVLTTSINLESGKEYKCTVTVSKMSNGINVGIDNWESDNIDYGGVVN